MNRHGPATTVMEPGEGFPRGTLLFYGTLDHGQVINNLHKTVVFE